jgi:hypothetical protein
MDERKNSYNDKEEAYVHHNRDIGNKFEKKDSV